jgi:hypothetical protein
MRKLVTSSTPLPSRDRQLARIRNTVAHAEQSRLSPRQLEAGVYALCGFFLGGFLAQLLALLTPAVHGIGLFVQLALGLVVFIERMQRGSWARSWSEELAGLLLRYDPLDKEAYRLLQDNASRTGRLDSTTVREFLTVEAEALGRTVLASQPQSVLQKLVGRNI